ncbi:capZ-interacting protein isoform X1 [Salmo trutta]|uniref:Zgc:153184 n=1 Tax=Salmo trutta TaxID=8032 RepID=A0A673WK60_SALTR|nr:capZ-interacting protein-like isoform X1 [Salmo trutta]
MEKDSTVKPSVAELAGRFKDHVIPMPTPQDQRERNQKPTEAPWVSRSRTTRRKPVKRRPPPCSLQLHHMKHDHEELEKPSIVSPHPPKVKMRTSKSSPLIERLQANLTLSPTSLLPSPKSPEVKLAPTPTSPATHCFFPTSPCSPLSPTLRPQLSIEEEEPVCFESPAEGTPLPSFNKSRVRLSFKRRPPTRQHRQSCGEEGVVSEGGGVFQGNPDVPQVNGAEDQVDQVFEQTREGGETQGSLTSHPDTLTETGDNDRDSEQAKEDKVLEEETVEAAPTTQDGKEEAGGKALGEPQASDSLEAIDEKEGSCSSIGDNNQTEEQEDPTQPQERDEHL